MTADFLDDVDYLEESPDIPESERRIFREEWPNNRSALVAQFREMIGAIATSCLSRMSWVTILLSARRGGRRRTLPKRKRRRRIRN